MRGLQGSLPLPLYPEHGVAKPAIEGTFLKHFRHEDVAAVPVGWRVRTVTRGTHRVRIACHGPRRGGECKLISILHPKGEANPCGVRYLLPNPSELLIMGANPTYRRPNPHTLGQQIARMKDRGASPREVGRMLSRATAESGRRFLKVRTREQMDRFLRPYVPNPSGEAAGAAEEMYETFHGRPAREIIELQEPEAGGRSLASLGDLKELTIKPVSGRKWVNLDFSGCGIKLAANAEGSQLYLIGGDQSLNGELEEFGSDTSKEKIELGEAVSIVYRAKKSFTDFKATDWEHQFAEESGQRPIVGYDTETERIFLLGGNYRVEAPGIIN